MRRATRFLVGFIQAEGSVLDPLLSLIDVKKHFPLGGGLFKPGAIVLAVDGVSLDVYEGDIVGLVGESGCGKTTLGRTILRLTEPTSGKIIFEGRDIAFLKKAEMKELRKEMQAVFQNPYASLNPRKTIGQIISQPLLNFRETSRDEIRSDVLRLLDMVGLTPPETFIDRNPHELSGGQRQRVGIARGIALTPRLIVADEPVSALDMSVRAQILNLIKEIKKELGLTLIFITHDLSVVRSLCNRVVVMYLGRLVEIGPVREIFENPLHPYTKALLSSTPIPKPSRARSRQFELLTGDVPSPINPPSGCRFHTRCWMCKETCMVGEPEMQSLPQDHRVRCHLQG